MIRIVLPSITIGIAFRHSKVEYALPQTAKEKKAEKKQQFRTTMGTFCELYEINGASQKWLCEGSTVLGVGDQFRKAEGRKIALTRALHFLKVPKFGEKRAVSSVILSKRDRELIWSVYNSLKKIRPTMGDLKNLLKQPDLDPKELIETLREILEVKVKVKDAEETKAPTV
jgi:hypothetical protein